MINAKVSKVGKEIGPTVKGNLGKTHTGKVVSNKVDKTTIIAIGNYAKHPLIGKIIEKIVKLKAYDKENKCGAGNTVKVIETRPLPKDKRQRLVEVTKKAR